MLRSKLYWRVLANFALLLIILTAMTVLTLNILSQIERNFNVAANDTRALGSLEQLRYYLNEVPPAANEYAIAQSPGARLIFEAGWQGFDAAALDLQKELADSVSVQNLIKIKELYTGWVENIGNKLMAIPDRNLNPAQLRAVLDTLTRLETQIGYMSTARKLAREIYEKGVSTQPVNIERATSKTRDLGLFIGLVNVMLALFAVALGFVLTRNITTPIRLLKEGTQKITTGTFEPIDLERSDELGELAEAFNRMAYLLGSNYSRLQAYSELVTTLNNIEEIREVESRSLQLLCAHTQSAVGALYLLDKDEKTLRLVANYGFNATNSEIAALNLGEGIPGQCALERQVIEISDIDPSTQFVIKTGFSELLPKSLIAVPIVFQDRLLGVLVLASMQSFDQAKKEIINNSVPQLGVALTNAMNNEATRKLSMEIATRNEELNSKNAELEKLYKVKSDFLASMSHELRTPLNSIIGFSSVLIGPTGDPLTRDQRMAIEKVLKNGKHLLQLINDILDLSKLESGRMSVSIETEDVVSVVSSCVLTVEPLVKSKNVSIRQEIPEDLPVLTTDIVKIRQILVNLLSNAAKFTEQGEILVKVWQHDGKVSFSVKDSGIGIEQKNLGLIFEEFQQVDSSSTRKYKGTGLGLPIARKLAQILEGDLAVASVFGQGSTFTLTIPPVYPHKTAAQTVPPPAPRPAPVAAAAIKEVKASPKGSQILCIDDDPDVIEILRKYLVPEGYSVAGALSGDEGIELAAKIKPALITLDIMMPKKDGWQVLRELKQSEATRNIPVIIHSIVENKPLAMTLGAVDVITKPTDPNRLLTLVKQFSTANGKHILVVDDNRDFAEAVKALMSQDGLNVELAFGGREALDRLKVSVPEVIILDLLMPDVDGFQVVQELQKNDAWRKIPVLILSGKELSGDELAKLNAHITEYLKKDDITRLDLSSTVKKILGRKS
ncbi:MAG TPA: response regulator [Bacteroidota bacterium]|nr:response regulator [Bacteroidota bacterium]